MKQKVLYTAFMLVAGMVANGVEQPDATVADPTLASSDGTTTASMQQGPQVSENVTAVRKEGAEAEEVPWPRGVFTDVTVGTQGIGGDIGYSFNKYLKLRVRGTYFPKYERTDDWNDISVDSSFKSNSCGLILDFHPWGDTFRLSVGISTTTLKVEADGSMNERYGSIFGDGGRTYHLGDTEYRLAGGRIGHVRGKYEWEKFQPYIGIGWSCSSKSKHAWYFTADIGVNIMGKGDLSVSHDGVIEQRKGGGNWEPINDADLKTALRDEGEDVFEIADKIVVYPVIHLGVGCRF